MSTRVVKSEDGNVKGTNIYYPALGYPCDVCGRPAFEFGHMWDGKVYSRHVYGRKEWTCRIR